MKYEKQYISEHLHDDIRQLALKLKAKPMGLDASFVLRQIAGRQAIRHKLPDWYDKEDILYPGSLSLEQCSSGATSRYKSALCTGTSFADLTGGFGVDCAAMASCFQEATYVERQEELCRLARHNFPLLGAGHTEVVQAEAEAYLATMSPVDFLYLDPARRDDKGKKTVFLSDCSPDVTILKDLLLQKAGKVLIKLSPMLDISLALQALSETRQVHVVSVDNECKELLFLLDGKSEAALEIHAVDLSEKKGNHSLIFLRKEEQEASVGFAAACGNYLYEPNVAVLKAGAYKLPAIRYGLTKLHPDSHLYTSETLVADFPGRIFRIKKTFSFHKKDLKEHLNGLDQANITVRNFPMSVEEIRKKTKLKAGGEVYLFATTLSGGERVMIWGERL